MLFYYINYFTLNLFCTWILCIHVMLSFYRTSKSHGVKVKSKQSQNTSELIFLRDTLHPNWSVSSAGLQRILFCSIELFKISGILWGTGGLKISRSRRAPFFLRLFWAVLAILVVIAQFLLLLLTDYCALLLYQQLFYSEPFLHLNSMHMCYVKLL